MKLLIDYELYCRLIFLQTEALLKAWKEREGSRAYTGDLKRALDSAGMQDASREISSS